MIARKAEVGRSLVRAVRGRRPFADFRPFAGDERAVQYDILRILWSGSCDAYGVMAELAKEPGVRPGPEIVYPTLQMLEAGDFVTGRCVAGKRVYTIGPKGSEYLAGGCEPERAAGSSEAAEDVPPIGRGIRTLRGLRSVLREIVRTRDVERYVEASAIVERARRELHALLSPR
jgi:hypothetical protein